MSITPIRRWCRQALLALALLVAATPHAAAEESGWSYEFTPYVFFSALEGTTDASGIVTDPGIVFPGGGASFSDTDSWLDAVAVGRVMQPLSDRWSLVAYADLGGGGSSLTYQFVTSANWAASERFAAKQATVMLTGTTTLAVAFGT